MEERKQGEAEVRPLSAFKLFYRPVSEYMSESVFLKSFPLKSLLDIGGALVILCGRMIFFAVSC